MNKKYLMFLVVLFMVFTIQLAINVDNMIIVVSAEKWESNFKVDILNMKKIITNLNLNSVFPIDLISDEVRISDFVNNKSIFKGYILIAGFVFIISILTSIISILHSRLSVLNCFIVLIIYNLLMQFFRFKTLNIFIAPFPFVLNVIFAFIGIIFTYLVFFVKSKYIKYLQK